VEVVVETGGRLVMMLTELDAEDDVAMDDVLVAELDLAEEDDAVTGAELEELTTELVELAVDELLEALTEYNCSLEPAPQYVVLSPGQRKLQSAWFVALTLPAPRELPQ